MFKQIYLLIDGTLTGIVTPGQSGLWKRYSKLPKAPELEPHHRMHVSVILRPPHLFLEWDYYCFIGNTISGSGQVCLFTGYTSGRPPGFNPLWRGWVYRLAPEAPLSEAC